MPGEVRLRRGARVGWVAQEAPGGERSPRQAVLDADLERDRLLAGGRTGARPRRDRRDSRPSRRHRRPRRAGAGERDPRGPRLRRRRPAAAARELLGRLAHAGRARRGAVRGAGPAAAGRADQPSRPRGERSGSRTISAAIPRTLLLVSHDRRSLEPRARAHRASRAAEAHQLHAAATTLSSGSARERLVLLGEAARKQEARARATSRPSSTASATRRARPARRRAASRRWPGWSRSPR